MSTGRSQGRGPEWRSQRGQASIEYLGVVIAAALIVAVLVTSGLGARVAGGIEGAICSIIPAGACDGGGGSEEPSPTTPVDPQLTPQERQILLGDPQEAQEVLDSLSPEERLWLEQNDPDAAAAVERAVDWRERRELVDRYMEGELEDYIDYRDSADRDGRLNSTNDGCSAPVVGSTGLSFDFTEACMRHDFGYRNYKELGLFDEMKDDVDRQFLEDMKDHCATRSVFLRWRCYDWAYTFYAAVRAFGGSCDLPDGPGPIPDGPRIPGPCAPEHG